MVRGLPAADVPRSIGHASDGRLVALIMLTHVLRLLQGRKLPGSILGSSVPSHLILLLITREWDYIIRKRLRLRRRELVL